MNKPEATSRPCLTVGELLMHLETFPKDHEITFGPFGKHISFYRTKQRSEESVNIEFNEIIEQNPDGSWLIEKAAGVK